MPSLVPRFASERLTVPRTPTVPRAVSRISSFPPGALVFAPPLRRGSARHSQVPFWGTPFRRHDTMGRSLPLVYRRRVAAYFYGTWDADCLCCMNMGSREPQTYFPRGTASFSRSSSDPSPDLSGCHTAIHCGVRVPRQKWDLVSEWERDDWLQ